jgi:predicted ATP-grasp superfamily ATP-dependent carboligase
MERGEGKPGAVILGGSFHSLGAARNLAEHNVPVCIVDSGPCVSRFSRSVGRFIKCPSADDETRFVKFLVQIAEDKCMNGWVLFPSTDEYVRILAQHRERLSEHYLFTIPSWEVVRFLYDKRLTHRLAEEREVPTPKTYNPRNSDELVSLNLDFPIVIKPAISKRFMAATKKKAFRVNNEAELIDFYERTAAIIDPSEILVQELIPGRTENLYSFVGFFKDGVTVAGMSARRLRQHPMEFGRASTYVESLNVPELETLATQFLKGIAYSGLAEVEFMYDQKDARFELLEVNPRIWGWHTITIQSGLDLPYLAYSDAIGQEFVTGPVREGVKWVRLVTDIPTAVPEILSGRLTLHQYLASMSGDIGFAVLSLSDPLPFIADLFLAPYNYLNGRGF